MGGARCKIRVLLGTVDRLIARVSDRTSSYEVGDRLPGSPGTIDTSNGDARVSPLTLARCLMLRDDIIFRFTSNRFRGWRDNAAANGEPG